MAGKEHYNDGHVARERQKEWPVSEWNRIECRKIMCEAMPQWSMRKREEKKYFYEEASKSAD
jgi:hypothetical protein